LVFTTHKKARKTTIKQLRIDSLVSVGYTRPHTHGLGIWKNPRVPMTIRVDKKLKIAFSEASKAFSGSTCSAIEYIMAAYVGAFKNQVMNGVYPKLTVDIGEIKIERNLRERRKLVKTTTEEIETVNEVKIVSKPQKPTTDWHGLSIEDLQKRFDRAVACDDVTSKVLCLAEMKHRGIYLKEAS
jgi:hypothetical protein